MTDMGAAIQTMAAVSHECLSTVCDLRQDTCGWYLQNAVDSGVRDTWLPKLASGEVLGGTGMSNTMKAFANIEAAALTRQARRRRLSSMVRCHGSPTWVTTTYSGPWFGPGGPG